MQRSEPRTVSCLPRCPGPKSERLRAPHRALQDEVSLLCLRRCRSALSGPALRNEPVPARVAGATGISRQLVPTLPRDAVQIIHDLTVADGQLADQFLGALEPCV